MQVGAGILCSCSDRSFSLASEISLVIQKLASRQESDGLLMASWGHATGWGWGWGWEARKASRNAGAHGLAQEIGGQNERYKYNL